MYFKREFKNGLKTGTWKYNLANTQPVYEEKYDDGKQISKLKMVVKSKIPYNSSVFTPQIFNLTCLDAVEKFMLDILPQNYVEGPKAYDRFLNGNLKFPKPARKADIKGYSIIKFNVNLDGTTDSFEIKKSLGYGCDEEAIRVLKLMGPWVPTLFAGRSIKFCTLVAVLFPYGNYLPEEYPNFPLIKIEINDYEIPIHSFNIEPLMPYYKYCFDINFPEYPDLNYDNFD